MDAASVSKKPQSLFVGLYNISDRSKAAIEMVLKSGGLNDVNIVAEHQAQVGIVDIDGGNPDEVWQIFRNKFPTQPAIVLSVAQPNFEGVFWVQKPVKPELLVEAVMHVAKQVRSEQHQKAVAVDSLQVAPVTNAIAVESKPGVTADGKNRSLQYQHGALESLSSVANTIDESEDAGSLCGKLPEIDIANIKDIDRWFYDPTLYLQGMLSETIRLARMHGKASIIECGGYVISVLPEGAGLVMTTMNRRRLRNVCLSSLGTLVRANVRELVPRKRTIEHEKLSQDSFLWFVALATSGGRLPVGTDLHFPVKLKCWPNFSRLEITPYAMQITTLWLNQSIGLLETASYLGIPQRYVFSFYSAVNAIGIATIETKALADEGATEMPRHPVGGLGTSAERRGFLSRMLAKLR